MRLVIFKFWSRVMVAVVRIVNGFKVSTQIETTHWLKYNMLLYFSWIFLSDRLSYLSLNGPPRPSANPLIKMIGS